MAVVNPLISFKAELRDCYNGTKFYPQRVEALARRYRNSGGLAGMTDNILLAIQEEVKQELDEQSRQSKALADEQEAARLAEKAGPDLSKLQQLAQAMGWQETDGPLPGVWTKYKPGNKCLWSVKWSVGGVQRVIEPGDLLAIETAPVEYLMAELVEVAARDKDGQAQQLARSLLAPLSDGSSTAGAAREYLRGKRNSYPEYLLPTLPFAPERIYRESWREEWPKAPWAGIGGRVRL